MADGYFMPKEKYEWLTGAVDRLTKDHDAATSRAERATVEVKAATKLLVTAWSERDAATSRAERAEWERDEAREALAAVAEALDGRKPPAHCMPAGYPDLAIGVQELRHALIVRAKRMEPVVEFARVWYANGVDPDGRYAQALSRAVEAYEAEVERWTGMA